MRYDNASADDLLAELRPMEKVVGAIVESVRGTPHSSPRHCETCTCSDAPMTVSIARRQAVELHERLKAMAERLVALLQGGSTPELEEARALILAHARRLMSDVFDVATQ